MIPIYPRWPIDPHSLVQFFPWVVLVGVVGWCWTRRASWGRHALLGLGFFLINLLPFIGFNSVSYMGFTWVMDHFIYLPMIGLVGLTIAALEAIDDRISGPSRYVLAGVTAVVLALLAWESEVYAGMFIGPEKLWDLYQSSTIPPRGWLIIIWATLLF